MCGEIRSEDAKTSAAVILQLSLILLPLASPAITPDALGDPMVALKRPGCDTNSPILVM